MKPEVTEADDAKVQEYARHVGGLTRWESEKLRSLFAMHRTEHALRLAEARLAMLMKAELPGSDHPTATAYVLKIVRASMTTPTNPESDHHG